MTYNLIQITDVPRSSDSIGSGQPPPAGEGGHARPTDGIMITDIDEQKLLRKIDLRVLPTITVIYVLAFLDR